MDPFNTPLTNAAFITAVLCSFGVILMVMTFYVALLRSNPLTRYRRKVQWALLIVSNPVFVVGLFGGLSMGSITIPDLRLA